MDNIKEYIERYVTFGKPVKYAGLEIQPVLVKDYFQFKDAVHVLQINKDKIPDVNIIEMSYLKFLALLIKDGEQIKEDFLTILALTLGLRYDNNLRDISLKPNEVHIQRTKQSEAQLIINGWDVSFKLRDNETILRLYHGDGIIEINDSQFDDVLKIILFQNLHDYDDMPMSDDFRRVVEEFYALKNKDIVMPTLEDKMMAVAVSSGYTLEQIYDMPLRLFDALFEYSVQKVEYKLNKLIVNLSQGEIKGFTLSHWVYKHKKDKYSEVFTDAESLVNKFKKT